MNEEKWDRLLQIRTTGRDDSHADQYRYPYEPTPYCVLERLANSGFLKKGNTLLDYGCGKGRVDFFLSWHTRCQSIGIEYDERIYDKAIKNREKAASSGRVIFELKDAGEFPVPENVDRKSCRKKSAASWSRIMQRRGKYCCSFIIRLMSIYLF